MFSHYVEQAAALNASDLHLSSGQYLFFRLNGKLQPQSELIFNHQQITDLIQPLLNTAQWQKLIQNKQLDLALSINQQRVRLNLFFQQHGLAIACRLIQAHIPTPKEINLPPSITELADLQHGLVLIAGATGSGKSTTLAALIQSINQNRSLNIISLEDPVEFIYQAEKSLIQQREIGQHCASFDQGLISALRQDPDVILIGELRDHHSIGLALTAAETGHLVLASIHSQSCSQAIDRMIDSFAEGEKNMIRAMLAQSLEAVVAQQLVPKIGGGRVALHEIMRCTPAIRHLIKEHKLAQLANHIQTGLSQGMQSLQQSRKQRIDQGLIAPER